MNFLNATKYAIEIARKDFSDHDIVIVGGGGAKYAPSLKHFEFFDDDLHEFKEKNKCLILVRVLEHVDILRYPDYFDELAKNNNAIIAVTPDMKKSYSMYKPNIKEIGNSLFMLSYTLFGQGDEYNDAHKWFVDEETIKHIRNYTTEIVDQIFIDTVPHIVSIHRPKNPIISTKKRNNMKYILPEFKINNVSSLGSIESVIEFLKMHPELRKHNLHLKYVLGTNDPVKNLDDIFMLAYNLQSIEFEGNIIFTELDHGKLIETLCFDDINELMYPIKYRTYIDENVLLLYLTENKDFEVTNIDRSLNFHIRVTCKVSE